MVDTSVKNTREQKAACPPDPPGSIHFQRLNEFLEILFRPWVELTKKAQREQAKKPKARPWEQGDITNVIAGLEEDELARALFRACIHGDLWTAKAIWETRGPFDIKYEYQKEAGQTLINDVVVDDATAANQYFTNIKDSAKLAELMEWMPKVGLGCLVGVGADTAPMLQSNRIEQVIRNVAWPSQFTGELPVLREGVLTSPDLFLALQAKCSTSAYPAIYQEILCWVHEGDVDGLGKAVSRYKSVQSLFLNNKAGTESLEVPVSEVSEAIVQDICTIHLVDSELVLSEASWKYRALFFQTLPENLADPKNRLVLGYQADEPLKHGFNHKQGYVLCRTTLDFLSRFPLGPAHPKNTGRAQYFVRGYFPLDLAMLKAPQVKRLQAGCLARKNGIDLGVHDTPCRVKEIYKGFGDDNVLQPYLKQVINPTLFGFIKQHYCYVSLDADSMIGLHQGLGMDNQGFSLEFDHKGLQRLRDSGFRFSDDSKTICSTRKNNYGASVLHRPVESETEVKFDPEEFLRNSSQKEVGAANHALSNRYSNAIAVNLWPAETPKPASLAEAMAMASRKKKWGETPHERSLLAYIDHAGMQACAEVAKSTATWTFLKDHFGREAMEPFMSVMTRQIRGRILMDDLGM